MSDTTQTPDVGISAVGPQAVHTYPIAGAGIVGVILKDTKTGETIGATVLTAGAARTLAAQLLEHAATSSTSDADS